MEFHEIAELFPLMKEKEFDALVESIKKNGLRDPILLYENKILDGRNRYKACIEAGIKLRYENWKGDDPWEFVWDTNAERRNINQGQKAAIFLVKRRKQAEWQEEKQRRQEEAKRARSEAAKKREREVDGTFAPSSHVSDDTRPEPDKPKEHTRDKIAEETKVSPATAGRLSALESTHPELVDDIAQGNISLAEANRKKNRDECPDPPEGKYRVIYADPPWEYADSGLTDYGPAERHYPTMNIPDLCKLPIKDLAEDNAILFLWTTSPLLEDAFKIIKAWGFKYKTSFIWDKVKHNHGHYNSVRHEFLLICTRGSCTPDVKELFDSVQSIERSSKHSEKPEEFRQIIDTLYTHGKKIELFARKEVEGWKAWGNEV